MKSRSERKNQEVIGEESSSEATGERGMVVAAASSVPALVFPPLELSAETELGACRQQGAIP